MLLRRSGAAPRYASIMRSSMQRLRTVLEMIKFEPKPAKCLLLERFTKEATRLSDL